MLPPTVISSEIITSPLLSEMLPLVSVSAFVVVVPLLVIALPVMVPGLVNVPLDGTMILPALFTCTELVCADA